MKFNGLHSVALAVAALTLFGGAANADTTRTVECANGKSVEASGTETDAAVCLTIGSQPAASKPGRVKYGNVTLGKHSPADQAKAQKYEQLAKANKPQTSEQEKLVKQYMKLPPSQRNGFKSAHPTVQPSIWDLGPYAVCFYASVAGGADVVEAGDECHAQWVE
ncbi:MAG TPA: hypothetical protein VFS58_06450 [Steroidobacteraceae bacterium]|nr:hypothetical protein [Steroidobacteraceae bacterium]